MTETTGGAAMPAETEDMPANGDKRRRLLTILAAALLIAALAWGIWYLLFQRGRVHTDNAYVGAEVALITPQIEAAVREVHVINTQMVRKGDLLLVLDDADAQVAVATAEAQLSQARQRYRQALATDRTLSSQVESRSADMAQAQARLVAANAEQERARAALARREALAGSGAVSAEELSSARAEQKAAAANVTLARAALDTARANRGAAEGQQAVNAVLTRGIGMESDPEVAAARARLLAARLDLARTAIRAPVSGIVTQSQVQVGQRVDAGSTLMRIVPVDRVYVDANFKEGQLRDVRIGQPVELTSDYYGGDVVFHGKVVGLAGATGAATALIPAQNASGNWVKVVQRLPVRVALDPEELRSRPLRIGLSMEAVIDTRHK